MISLTQGLLEARPHGEQRLQTMVNMKTVILHSTISLKQINGYGNNKATYEYRIDCITFTYSSFCACYFLPGSESSIRLVDVDGDGLKDIITGLAIGKDISSMVTEPDMDKFCRSIGKFQLSK